MRSTKTYFPSLTGKSEGNGYYDAGSEGFTRHFPVFVKKKTPIKSTFRHGQYVYIGLNIKKLKIVHIKY